MAPCQLLLDMHQQQPLMMLRLLLLLRLELLLRLMSLLLLLLLLLLHLLRGCGTGLRLLLRVPKSCWHCTCRSARGAMPGGWHRADQQGGAGQGVPNSQPPCSAAALRCLAGSKVPLLLLLLHLLQPARQCRCGGRGGSSGGGRE